MVEPASIEVSDLRPYDEGWYECSVVSMEDEQSTVNGSWIYLAVNGKFSSCIVMSVIIKYSSHYFDVRLSSTLYLPPGALLYFEGWGHNSEPFT
jgi:hypothetical protein